MGPNVLVIVDSSGLRGGLLGVLRGVIETLGGFPVPPVTLIGRSSPNMRLSPAIYAFASLAIVIAPISGTSMKACM